MTTYTLHLKQEMPFANCPAIVELDGCKIAVNDVNFPINIQNGYNPYAVGLMVIGNEYGTICAVWASCAQNALDEAVNLNLFNCQLLSDEDATDETPRLGNAGEPFDLDNVWIGAVDFQLPRDFELLKACILAEDSDSNFLE